MKMENEYELDSADESPAFPFPYQDFHGTSTFTSLLTDTDSCHSLPPLPSVFSSVDALNLNPSYGFISLAFDSGLSVTDSTQFLGSLPDPSTDHLFSSYTTAMTALTQLPNLHSLEQTQYDSSAKRHRSVTGSTNFESRAGLDSAVQRRFSLPREVIAPPVKSVKDLRQQRRKKISELIRLLEKLMPWNKKMDTATMLDEAYKYVKFLQAQVKALQWMPIESSSSRYSDGGGGGGGGGGVLHGGDCVDLLSKLNQQQLLQVVLNSSAAQTMLYSRGLCVFSREQLIFLKTVAEKKSMHARQMMMFDPSRTG